MFQNVSNIDLIIKKKREELDALGVAPQPLPILVGTLRNIESAYVVVDNMRYRAKTAIEAVGLTMKICHALDCDYPGNARNFWLFIQHAGFNVSVPGDNLPTKLEGLIGQVTA